MWRKLTKFKKTPEKTWSTSNTLSELASGEKKVEHLEQWRRFQGGYPVGRGAGQLKKTINNYVASPSIKKENLHFFPTPIESHIGFRGDYIYRFLWIFRCASISCTDDRMWLTDWLIETGDWQFRMFDSSRTPVLKINSHASHGRGTKGIWGGPKEFGGTKAFKPLV